MQEETANMATKHEACESRATFEWGHADGKESRVLGRG